MATHVTPEAELFILLVELLGDQRLERNALRVLAGARGHELGRPFRHLCQQGLIEEIRVRPGFFARLFGGRETLWVHVTDYGQRVAAELAASRQAETVAELPPQDIAPISVPEPLPEHLPEPLPEPAEIAAPAPQPLAKAPEAALDLPPQIAEFQIAEPEIAEPHVVEPEVVEPEVAAPEVAAPDLPPAPPVPAPPPQRKRRFTPSDFTETLGGTPMDTGFQIPGSDRLEGLSESLSLLGFELIDAGKLLAVTRWAQGQGDSDVALEIVTTALAHAMRLDATGTTQVDRAAASALVTRVTEAFAAYVSEGLLAPDSLTEARGRMAGFLEETGGLSVDAYLADPHRGMAPTAVCPDDIYLRIEVEED